jgi:two-component system cell cycle sensor histidine kinase/response regulator CckA
MIDQREIVLIVEDDEGVAALQQRRLTRAGFEVRSAETAVEAMAHLRRGGVQLVVLDYRLAGEMNGLEFYAAMKHAGYELPVIMVTGYSQESTVVEALRAGVRDFVTKSPDYLDYLVKTVERLFQQLRIERELAETRARLRAVVDSSQDAILTTDERGMVAFFNAAAERMFGCTAAEAVGQPIDRFSAELAALVQQAGIDRAEGCRSATAPYEMLATRSDGDRVPIETTLSASDVHGKALYTFIARDVRNRKQMEEEIARRDEQLRQSQKLEVIGSLAGGIAHEFNNLLQAIRGYTKYGMEGLPFDDQRYLDLDQVMKAADRATVLTRQLLGFSRRQILERVNCNPREIVTDLLKLLRPVIGEHIELEFSLASDASQVYADRGLLEQMLLNLCINARDAMPDGGRLRLKTNRVEFTKKYCELHPTAKPGSYLLFSVADTGHGMTPEVQAHIFEPFFTTKEVGRGTGLGLAMVYGAVQQHEGLINVYSEVGLGTTFKIYLPISNCDDAVATPEEASPISGGKETILLAEDDHSVRELAARILTGAGYSVLAAADGAEAMSLFEAHADDVSLALLDAVMPKLTGHEVFDRLRLIKPALPVVFCSGYDPEMGQVKSVMSKGLAMVQKPYDPAALLRAVRESLDAQYLPEAPLCHV